MLRRVLVPLSLFLVVATSFGAGAYLAGSGPSAIHARAPGHGFESARGTAEGERLRASALDAIQSAGSEAVRVDAIELLGFVGTARDVPALMEIVDGGGWSLQQAAILALCRIGDDKGVDLVVRVARSGDPNLSYVAWTALGASSNEKATKALYQRLDEGRDLNAVAVGLARSGSPAAAERLIRAFDRDWSHASEIAIGLASFGTDVPEARDALLAAARSPDTIRKQAAIAALATTGDGAVVDLLEQAIEEDDSATQIAVLSCLGQVRDERVPGLLVDVALHGHGTARNIAVSVMTSVGGPEVDAALVQIIRSGPADVAAQAVWSLQRLEDDGLVAALVDAARNRPMAVRDAAFTRLVSGPWGRDVPDPVLALARDRLRYPANGMLPAEAFRLLLQHGAPADRDLVETALLESPSWQRSAIVPILAGERSEWASNLLLELTSDPDPAVCAAAVDAALAGDPSIRSELEDRLIDQLDGPGRRAALSGLVRLNTPDARRHVLAMVTDGSTMEATDAINSISMSPDAALIAGLEDALDDVDDAGLRNQIYSSLLMSPEADPTAIAERALREDDVGIRAQGARALARSGTPADKARLISLIDRDDEPMVRQAALETLGQIGGPEAEKAAVSALDDPDLAPSALGALQSLGTRSAGTAIAELALHGDDPTLRAQAMSTLASFPSEQSENTMVRALEDDDAMVRSAAIGALQTTGTRTAAEALAGKLAFDAEDSRAEAEQAAWALRGIGGAVAEEYREEIDALIGAADPVELYGEGPYPADVAYPYMIGD